MTPLPLALSRVVIPRFLSPSRFEALKKCRLSVIAPDTPLSTLPVAPEAVLGIVLHHVAQEIAEGRWGGATSPAAAFDAVLAKAIAALEPGDAPLDLAVGRQRWFTRVARARSWAIDDAPPQSGGEPQPARLHDGNGEGGPTEARADIGHEAWIVWPDGRLRGRADLVELIARGRRVIENKSGRTHDRDGNLVKGIALQVGLYALAIESLVGGEVEIVIRGDERILIPWEATTRDRVRAELAAMLSALPAEEEVQADALASPGPHCRRCRIRPMCGAYLRSASLWIHPGTAGRMPFDVWGVLLRYSISETGVKVELRDDVGRFVVVNGLSPHWGIQRCAPGSRLYFFDLEADQDRQHAERVQPVNFREWPPRAASARRRAFRLWVYRGGAG